jgi:hypothetical protein
MRETVASRDQPTILLHRGQALEARFQTWRKDVTAEFAPLGFEQELQSVQQDLPTGGENMDLMLL